jgi:hypothetical protein
MPDDWVLEMRYLKRDGSELHIVRHCDASLVQ